MLPPLVGRQGRARPRQALRLSSEGSRRAHARRQGQQLHLLARQGTEDWREKSGTLQPGVAPAAPPDPGAQALVVTKAAVVGSALASLAGQWFVCREGGPRQGTG